MLSNSLVGPYPGHHANSSRSAALESTPVTGDDLATLGKGDEDAPFFSEAYLYTLVGKDMARSILGKLRRLGLTLGVAR